MAVPLEPVLNCRNMKEPVVVVIAGGRDAPLKTAIKGNAVDGPNEKID